jgi:cytochrome c
MRKVLLLVLLLVLIFMTPACFAAHGIGTPLTADEIAAWNIDVAPDGRGLPAGSGDVTTGAHVFAEKCAACHGSLGQGLIGDALVGGRGTLASAKPKRTVGSYWPRVCQNAFLKS